MAPGAPTPTSRRAPTPTTSPTQPGEPSHASPGRHDPAPGLEAAASRLAQLAADLQGELDAIAETTAASPDDEHDAEGSTVGYERARVAGLLGRTRRQLEGLREARRRLSNGEYHRCQACGGDIGADRLEALPSATSCVECARRAPQLWRSAAFQHRSQP